MFSRRAFFLCSIVSIATALSGGCSDPYGGRMEVSGDVKLQGQPIKDGSIIFEPLDKQDTHSGAQIADGEYRVPKERGLKPGKYLVRLTAGDGKTPARLSAREDKNPAKHDAAAPGGSTNILSMDLIPDDYNVRSKQQVEIRSDRVNRFDFDIPKATIPRKRS
jgi:hypothetical protein